MGTIEVYKFHPQDRKVHDPDIDPLLFEFKMKLSCFNNEPTEGYFLPLQAISHHMEVMGFKTPMEALPFIMKHWYAWFFMDEMADEAKAVIDPVDNGSNFEMCAHTATYLEYVESSLALADGMSLGEVEPHIPLLRTDPELEKAQTAAELMRAIRGAVSPNNATKPGLRLREPFYEGMEWDPVVKQAKKRMAVVREERFAFAEVWQQHMKIIPSQGLDDALEYLERNDKRVRALSDHLAQEYLRGHGIQRLSFRLSNEWGR